MGVEPIGFASELIRTPVIREKRDASSIVTEPTPPFDSTLSTTVDCPPVAPPSRPTSASAPCVPAGIDMPSLTRPAVVGGTLISAYVVWLRRTDAPRALTFRLPARLMSG